MSVAMILLLALTHAPAPRVKPPPPPPALVPAAVVMTWHGVDAYTVFHHDGFFACHWHGAWWHGHWSQERGTLKVEEWPMHEPQRRSTWAVRLTSPTEGHFPGGVPWRVVIAGGKVR